MRITGDSRTSCSGGGGAHGIGRQEFGVPATRFSPSYRWMAFFSQNGTIISLQWWRQGGQGAMLPPLRKTTPLLGKFPILTGSLNRCGMYIIPDSDQSPDGLLVLLSRRAGCSTKIPNFKTFFNNNPRFQMFCNNN